jgi:hypothetical protein
LLQLILHLRSWIQQCVPDFYKERHVLEVSPLLRHLVWSVTGTCMFKMWKMFWNSVDSKCVNYFHSKTSMKISILVKSLVSFFRFIMKAFSDEHCLWSFVLDEQFL